MADLTREGIARRHAEACVRLTDYPSAGAFGPAFRLIFMGRAVHSWDLACGRTRESAEAGCEGVRAVVAEAILDSVRRAALLPPAGGGLTGARLSLIAGSTVRPSPSTGSDNDMRWDLLQHVEFLTRLLADCEERGELGPWRESYRRAFAAGALAQKEMLLAGLAALDEDARQESLSESDAGQRLRLSYRLVGVRDAAKRVGAEGLATPDA